MKQPGDIICLPDIPPDLPPDLIETAIWLNGSSYNRHQDCALYIGDADQNTPAGYAIAAYPDGARKIALPEDQDGWLWSDLTLLDAHRDLIVQAAYALLGTPHSTLDYFALAAEKLGVPVGNHAAYLADPSHMIGAQMVEHCYRAAGIHLLNDSRVAGNVTPMDIITVIEHPENIQYG
jgi:hypothetical protein